MDGPESRMDSEPLLGKMRSAKQGSPLSFPEQRPQHSNVPEQTCF